MAKGLYTIPELGSKNVTMFGGEIQNILWQEHGQGEIWDILVVISKAITDTANALAEADNYGESSDIVIKVNDVLCILYDGKNAPKGTVKFNLLFANKLLNNLRMIPRHDRTFMSNNLKEYIAEYQDFYSK